MLECCQKKQFDHGIRRILVVEDDLINREILSLMLRDTYDILIAETGKQALELLESDYGTLSLRRQRLYLQALSEAGDRAGADPAHH